MRPAAPMEGSTQYNEEDEHAVNETPPKAKATFRRRLQGSTISPGSKRAGKLDVMFKKVQVMMRAELSLLRNDIEREMYARVETYKVALYADMRKEMDKEMFGKCEEMYAALKIEMQKDVEVKVMACVVQKRLEHAIIAFESWKSNAQKSMNEKVALIEGLKGELVGCKNIPMKERETPPSLIRELERIYKEQEEEDEEAEQEDWRQEKGGLSESGLERKKLLGKSSGLDESGDDKSLDDDNDMDNEGNSSLVLSPQRKEGPKEEPVIKSTPAKVASVAPGRTASASSTDSKGKRKAEADKSKPNVPTSSKKVKMESSLEDGKRAKDSAVMGSLSTKGAGSPPKAKYGTPPKAKPSSQILEENVKAVLKDVGPIKTFDLVNKFRNHLATVENRQAFAAVLKKISKINKTDAGNFIVLRKK